MSLGRASGLLLRAARSATCAWSASSQGWLHALEATTASRALGGALSSHVRSLHFSVTAWDKAPAAADSTQVAKVPDYLLDKDSWDEVWAYDPRFGTEDEPIVVPSVDAERIIGVTDPDDDTLVIWGILRENDPPRQLVPNGEFFLLKKVEKVERVGDVLGVSLE